MTATVFDYWRRRGLSVRAANVLQNAAIANIRQLRDWSEIELLRQPNCGLGTLLEIVEHYRPQSPSIPGLREHVEQGRAWRRKRGVPSRVAGPMPAEQRAAIGAKVKAAIARRRAAQPGEPAVLSESDRAEAARAKERHAASLQHIRGLFLIPDNGVTTYCDGVPLND